MRTLVLSCVLFVLAPPAGAQILGAPPDPTARAAHFREVVVPAAASQGMAAVDRLADETLASKEDVADIFVALAEFYDRPDADTKRAVRLGERAVELAEVPTGDAEVADRARLLLGRTYVRAKEPKRAARVLERVTPTGAVAGEAASALSEAYAATGDRAKAFEAAARASAVSPTVARSRALVEAARLAKRTDAEATAAVWAARDLTAAPAPALALAPTGGGEAGALADYRGKAVLLNFWYPACAPCRAEFPELERLYGEYKARGLEVVAIDVTSQDDAALAFLKERGISFRSFRGDVATAEAFGVEATPTTIVIDRDGRVLFTHVGYGGPPAIDQISRELDEVLARPATR